MSYTVDAAPGIAPRDPNLPWDANAPGLYQVARSGAPCSESVVQLDSLQKIAVSVEEEYRETDLGLHLFGWGRFINDDGSSKTTPDGKAVEVSFSVGVSKDDLDALGVDTFRREVLLAVLGEPGGTRSIPNNPTTPVPLTDAQTAAALTSLQADGASPDATITQDATATTMPILRVSDEQRQSGDVRNALTTLAAMETPTDPATLLG